MAEVHLTLGGYTFEGFGVPDKINGGGAHHLIVHKLIGGARVIDALGPDDDAIKFVGRFRGKRAMADATLMDAMRRAGKPVTLTYHRQFAIVVVSKFTFSFERFYEVPYEVECTVVTNAAAQSTNNDQTLDGAVAGDINLAGQTAGGSAAVQSQVGTIATSYSQNAPLSTAQKSQVNAVNGTINNSITATNGIGAAANPPVGSANYPALPLPGGDPAAMSGNFSQTAQTMTDGAAAQNTAPVMQRMNTNIGNASGGEGLG